MKACSSMAERCLYMTEVGGSTPSAPMSAGPCYGAARGGAGGWMLQVGVRRTIPVSCKSVEARAQRP